MSALRVSPEDFAKLQARLKGFAHGQDTKPERTKYGNTVTEYDGMRFDSKAEANRWHTLKTLERIGEIAELKAQVTFELLPTQDIDGKKEKPVRYIADFTYMKDGKLVVEDVKSGPTKTKEFILKRKMMLFFHGIVIKEVMAG